MNTRQGNNPFYIKRDNATFSLDFLFGICFLCLLYFKPLLLSARCTCVAIARDSRSPYTIYRSIPLFWSFSLFSITYFSIYFAGTMRCTHYIHYTYYKGGLPSYFFPLVLLTMPEITRSPTNSVIAVKKIVHFGRSVRSVRFFYFTSSLYFFTVGWSYLHGI